MSKLYLILRLEGPLQSWGIRGRWDYRDSGGEPTKSGVIGLLGCALGYPMGDSRLTDLDKQLEMGVRIEVEGARLTDYHTVNAYKEEANAWRSAEGSLKKGGIVSYREYLQGAAFLIILKGEKNLIERCACALQEPAWPYYLGRKCCIPTRPVFDAVRSDFANIMEAIRTYPCIEKLEKDQTVTLRYVVDDVDGLYIRNDCMQNNAARAYGFRRVSIGEVVLASDSKEGS